MPSWGKAVSKYPVVVDPIGLHVVDLIGGPCRLVIGQERLIVPSVFLILPPAVRSLID